MRVYFDTGVFIDFLSARGSANTLRSTPRRGRTPQSIVSDAEKLFESCSKRHVGATSCLTYYEVEEALYRELAQSAKGIPHAGSLLIPAARSVATQAQMVIELFGIQVMDLTAATVRIQLEQIELQTRGIRAADALHAATAIAFNADLLVTTDDAVLELDGVLVNGAGGEIMCRDTDQAIALL